jgi:signal transduction histidine kinase/CheY-like chemotaxis protein
MPTSSPLEQKPEPSRRDRRYRLAAYELPLLRLIGSVFLTFAVWLNNRYLVPRADIDAWKTVAAILAIYAGLSWLVLIAVLRRRRDLTPWILGGDLLVWTAVLYLTGAEQSWLFFVLLLRVADQTQTTFRRAIAFSMWATACYAAMLVWVLVDGRTLDVAAAMSRLAFIFIAGLYIALAARTAEARRVRLAGAIRTSRNLIRRMEEQSVELREAHTRAEEASAAKSEFVANMSHEMRTPLQGVLGVLQLAIEDEPSEAKARRLETAKRSAETLLSMIDDILDFSRIEARKLELEPVYFSLRHMLAETMKALGVIAAGKRLTLSYLVQPDVPETVWGDPQRLRQVLVNLVGNAVKFTHEGEIMVTVSRAQAKVRFDVRDTGIGIAPSVRERIFEPFTQADSSFGRRHGGAGLGLSIVARLLEVMGGSVDVSSEQGAGSVFSFIVPLTADAIGAAPQRRPWEATLAGSSVLVVEPAEMSRGAIAEMLRSRGIFASAFASASQAPEGGRYLCAVTADSRVAVQPQVLIASPLSPPEDTIHVTRPIVERELIDAIGMALGLLTHHVEYSLPLRMPADDPQRILLVDDNEVNREILGEMIRRLGHLVTLAWDGEEALSALAREKFDLVFMDVQLPGIDGLEVTRRFRAAGGMTPIIALTAHSTRDDAERCIAAGMRSVLVKPVDSAQLAAMISDTPHAPESLLDVVGGNADLFARVREVFARQTPEILAAMRAAAAARDSDALARHAHKLKGSLSNFPGQSGVAVAANLENAARLGDLERVDAMVDELEAAVARLNAQLATV